MSKHVSKGNLELITLSGPNGFPW